MDLDMSNLTYDEIPKQLQRFRADEWITDEETETLRLPWIPAWLAAKRWQDAIDEWASRNGLTDEQKTIMLWQCDPFAERSEYGRPMDDIEAQVVGIHPPTYPIQLRDVEPEFDQPEEDDREQDEGIVKKVIKSLRGQL